jgi:hypothetical protein
MATTFNNNGHPLDDKGNVQVDFVWGNMARQPNDARTTTTDTNVVTATTDPVYSSTNLGKRLIPGKDNHDTIFSGYAGYPLFSRGVKDTNGQYQGDAGVNVQGFSGTTSTATVSSAALGDTSITVSDASGLSVGQGVAAVGKTSAGTFITSINGSTKVVGLSQPLIAACSSTTFTFGSDSAISYTAKVIIPEVKTLSTALAQDALRDAGLGTITVNSAAAGGTATISNVAVTTNVATLTSNGHGFAIGDVVTVYGFTSGNAGVNGSWVITGVATNTFTFATPATATISTNAATGYAIISATRTKAISNVALTSNVATITSPSHGFAVGDVVTITGATTTALNVASKTISAVTTDTFQIPVINADIASVVDATGIVTGTSAVTSAKTKAISSFAQTSSTITLTTTTAHGFSVGDLVNLNTLTNTGLNNSTVGTQAITAVPSSTTFSIAKPAGYSLPSTITLATTGATGDGTKITYTNSGNNGLTAGQTVSVSGVSTVVTNSQSPVINNNGSVTLSTTTAHGLSVGNTVTIASTVASSATGNTGLYNGTFVVGAVPTSTSFTVSNIAAILQSSTTSGGVTTAYSYPLTTGGTVTAADGSGLNISGVVLSSPTTTSFAIASTTTGVGTVGTGTGTILTMLDTTGQAIVGAKTGTIKSVGAGKEAGTTNIAYGTVIDITPYN